MFMPNIIPDKVGFSTLDWEKIRRTEILHLFEQNVYGVTPTSIPDCDYEIYKDKIIGNAVKRDVYVRFSSDGKTCGFSFSIYMPMEITEPLPAVIMINCFSKNNEALSHKRAYEYLPYDIITENKCIGIIANVDEFCIDDSEEYRKGILEQLPSQGKSGWGAIGAWAWGASRVMDYALLCKEIDSSRVAVCGCSRAGKAALWCGAQDTRFALTISLVSGCTGAALTRGKTGEHIRDITGKFPHWMCNKYAEFSDRENELPIDQHMLLSLCAPRLLYVSSASEDSWADPRKEFESCILAGSIYELYGARGLSSTEFPEAGSAIHGGSIGYHLRKGPHGCYIFDWKQYLKYIHLHL